MVEQGGRGVLVCAITHVDIRERDTDISRHGTMQQEVTPSSTRCRAGGSVSGEAFRTHGIVVGEVLTSTYCRCIDTGMLAFGARRPFDTSRPPATVSEGQAKDIESGSRCARNSEAP